MMSYWLKLGIPALLMLILILVTGCTGVLPSEKYGNNNDVIQLAQDHKNYSYEKITNQTSLRINFEIIEIKRFHEKEKVSFSSDGLYYCVGRGNEVKFYRNGTLLWNKSFDRNIISTAVSDNGEIVVVGFPGKIEVYSNNGELLWDFPVKGEVTDISISKNLKYFGVLSSIREPIYIDPEKRTGYLGTNTTTYIYLLDKDGNLLLNDSNEYFGTSISVADNGNFVCAFTHLLSAYDMDVPLVYYELSGEKRALYSLNGFWDVDLSQDGKKIAAMSSNGVDISYMNSSLYKLWNYTRFSGSTARAVSISSDGNYVLAGLASGDVTLFDMNGRILGNFNLITELPRSIIVDISLNLDEGMIIVKSIYNDVFIVKFTMKS
jgi:WD40 repeat protein